jgi:transcriptional regulator with XRE-family HTH domain
MAGIKTEFGKKLREMRKLKQLSQEQLAHLAGIDMSYIGRMERGETNVTLEILERLSKALKCEPRDLLP